MEKRPIKKHKKPTNDNLRCWFVDGSTWNGLCDGRKETSIGAFRWIFDDEKSFQYYLMDTDTEQKHITTNRMGTARQQKNHIDTNKTKQNKTKVKRVGEIGPSIT